MLRELHLGSPIYSHELGSVVAEVYYTGAEYQVFIVGERLASFLGSSTSLDDCMEEISSLQCLVESDAFQGEVAKYC